MLSMIHNLRANAIGDLRVPAELPSRTVLNLDGTTADVCPLAGARGEEGKQEGAKAPVEEAGGR